MDNLNWYKGTMLKRQAESYGQKYTPTEYAVALILSARERGLTLEDVARELILANEFDFATSKLDKEATIRELGF